MDSGGRQTRITEVDFYMCDPAIRTQAKPR
jgi:hypothetical protein